MSQHIDIKREVEAEGGLEYVWWTVVDHKSGYNKTFRTEAEAKVHAAELRHKREGSGL